jgi:hypothetical protein
VPEQLSHRATARGDTTKVNLTRRLDAGTSKLGDEIRFKAAAEMELKRYVIVFALRCMMLLIKLLFRLWP